MAGRMITAEEKKYLLSLSFDDFYKKDRINFDLLIDLMGTKTIKGPNGLMTLQKPKFDPTDEFYLLPGEYHENKEKLRTTVGQYTYNMILFGDKLYNIVGYVNKTLNNKRVAEVEGILAVALQENKITSQDFIIYLDRFQELSLGFHHVIASSFTMRGLKPVPKVIKHRDQLLKENEEKVKQGDTITIANIESTLIKEAEEILHDEPSLALYRSGARGSMGNNYKSISIMQGPKQNPIDGSYELVSSSFMEGTPKESIAAVGNAVVGGAYPKAVGTAVGGYKFKEMSAALQAIVCDEPHTDCGSKGYINVIINNSNKKEYMNRYIIEGGKLVQLTPDIIDKYLNKPLKMRDAMYCTGDKICSACAGEQFNIINIKQIGLASSKVATTMVKLGMKKFHDSSVKIYDIDINDITI